MPPKRSKTSKGSARAGKSARKGATRRKLEPTEPLHMTTRAAASHHGSVTNSTGTSNPSNSSASSVGTNESRRSSLHEATENVGGFDIDRERPAKIARRSLRSSRNAVNSDSPDSNNNHEGHANADDESSASQDVPINDHPDLDHVDAKAESNGSAATDLNGHVEDSDIPEPTSTLKAKPSAYRRGGRRTRGFRGGFLNSRFVKQGTPMAELDNDLTDRQSPEKQDHVGAVDRVAGRRRPPHADLQIEVALRRQLDLKQAYRAVARALKPVLAELAGRTMKDLTNDVEFHKSFPEYTTITEDLQARLDQTMDMLNVRLEKEKERLERTKIAQKEIIKRAYEFEVEDKREEFLLNCKEHFLGIWREAQVEDDEEATMLEVGIIPPLHADIRGERIPLSPGYDSRSRPAIELERLWDEFTTRNKLGAALQRFDPSALELVPKKFAVYDGDRRRRAIAHFGIDELLQASEDLERPTAPSANVLPNAEAAGLQALVAASEMRSQHYGTTPLPPNHWMRPGATIPPGYPANLTPGPHGTAKYKITSEPLRKPVMPALIANSPGRHLRHPQHPQHQMNGPSTPSASRPHPQPAMQLVPPHFIHNQFGSAAFVSPYPPVGHLAPQQHPAQGPLPHPQQQFFQDYPPHSHYGHHQSPYAPHPPPGEQRRGSTHQYGPLHPAHPTHHPQSHPHPHQLQQMQQVEQPQTSKKMPARKFISRRPSMGEIIDSGHGVGGGSQQNPSNQVRPHTSGGVSQSSSQTEAHEQGMQQAYHPLLPQQQQPAFEHSQIAPQPPRRKRPGPRAHYSNQVGPDIAPHLHGGQAWSPFNNIMGPPTFLPKYIKNADLQRRNSGGQPSNSPGAADSGEPQPSPTATSGPTESQPEGQAPPARARSASSDKAPRKSSLATLAPPTQSPSQVQSVLHQATASRQRSTSSAARSSTPSTYPDGSMPPPQYTSVPPLMARQPSHGASGSQQPGFFSERALPSLPPGPQPPIPKHGYQPAPPVHHRPSLSAGAPPIAQAPSQEPPPRSHSITGLMHTPSLPSSTILAAQRRASGALGDANRQLKQPGQVGHQPILPATLDPNRWPPVQTPRANSFGTPTMPTNQPSQINATPSAPGIPPTTTPQEHRRPSQPEWRNHIAAQPPKLSDAPPPNSRPSSSHTVNTAPSHARPGQRAPQPPMSVDAFSDIVLAANTTPSKSTPATRAMGLPPYWVGAPGMADTVGREVAARRGVPHPSDSRPSQGQASGQAPGPGRPQQQQPGQQQQSNRKPPQPAWDDFMPPHQGFFGHPSEYGHSYGPMPNPLSAPNTAINTNPTTPAPPHTNTYLHTPTANLTPLDGGSVMGTLGRLVATGGPGSRGGRGRNKGGEKGVTKPKEWKFQSGVKRGGYQYGGGSKSGGGGSGGGKKGKAGAGDGAVKDAEVKVGEVVVKEDENGAGGEGGVGVGDGTAGGTGDEVVVEEKSEGEFVKDDGKV